MNISTAADPAPRTVVCMKWGAKYGADYVNRLYGMAARQLDGPFGFVCLTDDAAGVRPEVTCAPIPALPPFAPSPERGWRKLGAFSPELTDLLPGRVLFLDLDVVIVAPLDPLFDEAGDFLIIRDWYHPFSGIGNSSVFRYELAAGAGLFADFEAKFAAITKRHRNEQEYLTQWMREAGRLDFWPAAWCRSFRRDCAPPWPVRYWRTPTPPPGSRVVVFHGDPKPPEVGVGNSRPFGFLRPAPWISEYWRS